MKMKLSRRGFLGHGALAVGALGMGSVSFAAPNKKETPHPAIGIQLYTLGDIVETDTARVFEQLADFGYEELEAVTYETLSSKQVRQQAKAAGLRVSSVHLGFSSAAEPSALFDTAHELGVNYAVSSILAPEPGTDDTAFIANTDALSVDDYKKIAERANRIAEQARREGIQYAYHNHDYEFRTLENGKRGYDILLEETDESLVQFEADCGWMRAAGVEPIHYFRDYPKRYRAVHIKDFDTIGFTTSLSPEAFEHITELGHGVIDYPSILPAALDAGVKHFFAEHDPLNGVPIPMAMVGREGRYLRGVMSRVRAS